MNQNKQFKPFIVAVTILMFTMGIFSLGVVVSPYLQAEVQADNEPATILANYEQALTNVYQNSVPGVVYINVAKNINHPVVDEDESDSPFSIPDLPDGFFNQGQGSGFVWDKVGHIVTNNHVVAGADNIEVIFADGTNVDAELIGTDPDSDLAIIKVNLPASQLQPLPLGDSLSLNPGQLAIAIGNPFGQDFTMTTGIVSAVGRTIRSGRDGFSIPEVVQTDAPINPGNSGGPLLNRDGQVIGINTQILSRSGVSSGVGFAVPVDIAKQVIPTLIKGERYEYAWLGISGNTLTDEMAEILGLPHDTQGALIVSLANNGPAEQAGLRGGDNTIEINGLNFQLGGDIITAVENRPIGGINDLISYLVNQTKPNDTITVTILRDGETTQVDVTLGTRPQLQDELPE